MDDIIPKGSKDTLRDKSKNAENLQGTQTFHFVTEQQELEKS